MSLPTGTRLGPYEVTAPLGAGGMGEVYRARDTRLGRDVALKVLPPSVTGDAAARERFEREARLIASLQHPHICVLHDVGHEGETPYLVMELLAGETLDARLARGRLPLDDALAIAGQIAQALDAAHRAGVVHRDLKPANVILQKSTGGGASVDVKLLDFGVAKPVAVVRRDARAGHETGATGATTSAELTDRHTLVGTLPYMAPEQLGGQPADARTDLWALGCVLYEMLTGTRPFKGETTVSLMAAILEHPPAPIAERVPLTPPLVDHLVRRCLDKDPERRWQSARDVALELDWARTRAVEASPATPRSASPIAWLLGVAAALAAIVTVGVLYRREPTISPAPVTRLSMPAPAGTVFLGGRSAPYFAVSADARRVAFVPTPYGRGASIWVRDLSAATARMLPDTVGATYPFWSPDGSRLGFFADGKLKVVDPEGGRPRALCDAPSARGGTWNQVNDIVFTPRVDSALYRVAADGGTPVTVTSLNAARREVNHKLPAFLPDGRRFLFVNQNVSAADTDVYVGSLDSAELKRVLDVASRAEFADGFLWYANEGSLVAHEFDPTNLRLSGEPHRVGDDVAGRNTIVGDALFSIAGDGTAVVWNGPQAATTQLTWYDRSGRRLGSMSTPDRYFSIALSPDDGTIAVEVPDPEGPFYNVWTMDVATGVKARVTSGSLNWGPVWSPDGGQIAYGSLRGGPSEVFRRGVNGNPRETSVWKSSEFVGPTSWLPDGGSVVLIDATHYRIGVLPLSPSQPAAWIPNDTFIEGDGRVSPDGRWLAYTSNESGTWDVYVKPFPALDRKWRVSPAGGSGPTWRRDSAEIYFVDPDQNLIAAQVRPRPTPLEGPPARLFALPIVPTPPGIDPRLLYAPTAKGDRFLVNAAVEAGSQLPLTVVLNVAASLRSAGR